MKKISIVTQYDMEIPNGSTVRPKWEFEALKNQDFKDVQLIDKFDETKLKEVSNTLIHAQQLSGRLLENKKYFVDIHGLEYVQSSNLINGFPIYSWRKYAFFAKSIYYKKLETKIYSKSVHLICSSEEIQERVKNIQNSTLVRNAIFLKDYEPTKCTELKIALVGPFLPGTINYAGLPIIKKVVQNLPEIKFVFIGKAHDNFKNKLKFKNVEFLGMVKNYSETLSNCSVLFSPYPDYAKYLGSKNKFLEAAACKMPIITTPAGSIDFKKDLLLIGKDTKQLVELILSLNNENERKKIGNDLRLEIERKYNADIEVKKLIKLYNEYLN